VSLISRLRAVVAGDDYLDGDYDDLDYDTGEQDDVEEGPSHSMSSALAMSRTEVAAYPFSLRTLWDRDNISFLRSVISRPQTNVR